MADYVGGVGDEASRRSVDVPVWMDDYIVEPDGATDVLILEDFTSELSGTVVQGGHMGPDEEISARWHAFMDSYSFFSMGRDPALEDPVGQGPPGGGGDCADLLWDALAERPSVFPGAFGT